MLPRCRNVVWTAWSLCVEWSGNELPGMCNYSPAKDRMEPQKHWVGIWKMVETTGQFRFHVSWQESTLTPFPSHPHFLSSCSHVCQMKGFCWAPWSFQSWESCTGSSTGRNAPLWPLGYEIPTCRPVKEKNYPDDAVFHVSEPSGRKMVSCYI